MNKLLTLTSALLLAGATAMPAFAQDHGHDNDRSHQNDSRDNRGHDDRNDGGRRSDGQWDNHGRDDRNDHDRYGNNGNNGNHNGNRRYYAPRQYHYNIRYVQPRGYHYNRWNVGTRLPNGYYGSSYYVDYRPYGLSAPPRGYRWVRVDRDVYLVAVGTGLIRDIMYGLFY